MDVMEFCTCENRACGCHPTRHSDGCDRCIRLNLQCNAIPRCFFHKLGCRTEEIETWSFEEFALHALKKKLEQM